MSVLLPTIHLTPLVNKVLASRIPFQAEEAELVFLVKRKKGRPRYLAVITLIHQLSGSVRIFQPSLASSTLLNLDVVLRPSPPLV